MAEVNQVNKVNAPAKPSAVEQRVEKLESGLKQVASGIKDLRDDLKVQANLVDNQMDETMRLMGHMLTRLETLIRACLKNGVLTDEQWDGTFKEMEEFQFHCKRIHEGQMPMSEKIEEVLKWNADKGHVPMDMTVIGLHEYLLQNPDKLPMVARKQLAIRAGLGDQFIAFMKQQHEQQKAMTQH